MISLGGFVVGSLVLATGVSIVLNAYYLNSKMLFLDFWENKFGVGTGTNGYQFFGFVLIIIGMFSMIGIIDITSNPIGVDNTQTNTNSGIVQPAVNNGNDFIGR